MHTTQVEVPAAAYEAAYEAVGTRPGTVLQVNCHAAVDAAAPHIAAALTRQTPTLDLSTQGTRFQQDNRILAQVGWLGHRKGIVYALGDKPGQCREPGGLSPLYICVGFYETDDDGNQIWKD